MHKEIKLEIIDKFDTQSDFALAIKGHESKISQVIRGRRKLTKKEAKLWQKALQCRPALLKPVTKR